VTVVSHTDKTNPYFVKQFYAPTYLMPFHQHEYHECNLPPKPSIKEWRSDGGWMGGWDAPCFWWPTFEFWRSRWAKCPCYMCHGSWADWGNPRSARRSRRDARRYCQDTWRDEY
jgi:hypothetical protein